MKRILGLDLGTTSIGWAVINETEAENETAAILGTGVRVVPLTVDEQANFEKGKSITTNADRTLKRGMRRNLSRYKQRREHLLKLLLTHGLIKEDTVLAETGKGSTHTLWALRADAATKRLELEQFARVLLTINKKRGYKSNRKAKDEGQAFDGMTVARQLYDNDLTCGQYGLQRLKDGKRYIPDFYRSDLKAELDRIWNKQREYHGELLGHELKEKIAGKKRDAIWAILEKPWSLVDVKRTTKGPDKKLEEYQWRVDALSKQLELEQLAVVLQQIHGAINGSSGLLGAISDRSKQLMIQDLTVGQYLYAQLRESPHKPLRGQAFYRQDYLDEFERTWETQASFHPQLTSELKAEVRDTVIFYQRRLRSQKDLLAVCEFESRKEPVIGADGKPEVTRDGKPKLRLVGPKVCPRSSPLYQEFRIWQVLNNLELVYEGTDGKGDERSENGIVRSGKAWCLGPEYKARLFTVLNWTKELSSADTLKLLKLKPKEWKLNFKKIEGNRTNQRYLDAFMGILEVTGHDVEAVKELPGEEQVEAVEAVLEQLGVDTGILHFDASLTGKAFEQQPAYAFWHLLYSYEGDNTRTGNERLITQLTKKFNFNRECAEQLCKITFEEDHGSLSTKAIKKILPHLKSGLQYDQACEQAGYDHSHSVTAEENATRALIDKLELLPRNSLRNPVVEKILNQLVHVVNKVIEVYGRPDEIRVELARELKNSAKEREEMTQGIEAATKAHDGIRKEIAKLHPFSTGVRITRNDIIKYKLWEELSVNSYRTLYSDVEIPKEKLFSKEYDIEHIIPQARLFDDSFSNKTLELRSVNMKKSNATAMDFMETEHGPDSEQVAQYKARAEKFFKKTSPAKFKKLMMKEADIPDGLIDRDLRNTQYITRKALGMLREVTRTVTATTGRVTDRVRQDWQLINVLEELNRPKYVLAGLTHTEKTKDGATITKITDWTKRNDHRHHAMDAIAVAFTRPSHIQYLNYLNARRDETHKKHANIHAIEAKETYLDAKNRRLFKPPLPLDDLRAQVKQHLEGILVSFKAKNKVTTWNVNKSKQKKGYHNQQVQTPRGQLHKESVYGKKQFYATKLVKVGPSFDSSMIAQVAKASHRQALLLRLHAVGGGDPKKAFGGKNALAKNPIWLDDQHKEKVPEKVKLVAFEYQFTIRKDISPDLFKDSKKKDDFENRVNAVHDKAIVNALKAHYERTRKQVEEFNMTVSSKKEMKKTLETAFSNLDGNPIWLNRAKGIKLKRVTITGVSNADALHTKHDLHGQVIKDADGKQIPTSYVQTGNNHHVAIYRDAEGNLQEVVVSFMEAVVRRLQKLPEVDRHYKQAEGWTFLFTMKQNEMFVFPNPAKGFDPAAIDLMDPANTAMVAPNLFRVQKISTKYYVFNHHFETQAVLGDTLKQKELNGVTYQFKWTPASIAAIAKVRIDHLGRIVHVGEY